MRKFFNDFLRIALLTLTFGGCAFTIDWFNEMLEPRPIEQEPTNDYDIIYYEESTENYNQENF